MRQAVRLQKKALLFTDERSKLEGELLNGIDVVKCNSWEVCSPRGAVLGHTHGCTHQAGAHCKAGSASCGSYNVMWLDSMQHWPQCWLSTYLRELFVPWAGCHSSHA